MPAFRLFITSACLMGGLLTAAHAQQTTDSADRVRRAEQEELRRLQRIEEMRRDRQNPVTYERPKPLQGEASILIPITKVIAEGSKVLETEAVREVASRLEGRKVTYRELLDTVEALNDLYRKKKIIGFAFLPPQKLVGGVLRVALLDGQLGKIEATGMKSTNPDFALGFLRAKSGGIVSIGDLSSDVERLRASTDLSASLDLKPGEKTGEVDAVLTVVEPPRNFIVTAGMDNFGPYASGRLRSVVGASMFSLTGRRDTFGIDVQRSQGVKSGALSYDVPLGTFGTRLRLETSATHTESVNGTGRTLDIKGPSFYQRVTLSQVLVAEPGFRLFGTLSGHARKGWTMLSGLRVGREEYLAVTPGIETVYSFGALAGLQRLGMSFGENHTSPGRQYSKLLTEGLVTLSLPAQFAAIFRGAGQYSRLDDPLPSAEKFTLGGFGRLRGYPVDYFSGSQGVYGAAEVGRTWRTELANFDVQLRPYVQIEYGYIRDRIINPIRGASGLSAGGGIDLALGKHVHLRLAGAAPLRKITREQNQPGPTLYASIMVTPF